jgi:chitosanase
MNDLEPVLTRSTKTNLLKIRSILLLNCGLLAAFGGVYAQSPAASGTQDEQDAQTQSEPCDSAWTSTATYDAGNVASYEGRNYTAAYGTQGNSPSTSSGTADSGQPWRIGAACTNVAVAAKNNPDANFSASTLQFLKDKTGLDGEQWNNIMKLISKPEQDSLDWTKYYGYCQNIGDKRGYTIGIFGATTGGPNDTGPDAPELFKQYDAIKGATIPSAEGGLRRTGAPGRMSGSILQVTGSSKEFCGELSKLQNDPAWREAMWRTFYNVYIEYSVQQARQRGFNSALTIGSFVDTALNQGATGDRNSLQGLLSRSGDSPDQKTFMRRFYAERSKVVDTSQYNMSPNGKNRVKQWSTLMEQGQTNLKNADSAIVKVTHWTMR